MDQRRQDARWARQIFDAQWRLLTWGTNAGSLLSGEFGDILEQEIRARFASGPEIMCPADKPYGEPVGTGRFRRWEQIRTMLDASFHPVRDAVRELSLLYRQPLVIEPEIPSPVFSWLTARSSVTSRLFTAQQYMLGLGSIAVRPSLTALAYAPGEFAPPGVDVVLPEDCSCELDPSRPGVAWLFIEHRPDHVLVWDTRNPLQPVFGRWRTEGGFRTGQPSEWSMVGTAYPWWWQGEPIMPVSVRTSPLRPDAEPLTVDTGEFQSCLSLIMKATWADVVRQAGSFRGAVILSDQQLTGIDGAMADASPLRNIYGQGTKSLHEIESSVPEAVALRKEVAADLERFARRYDSGFGVQTAAAQSGVALSLRLTGKQGICDTLETYLRPHDQHLMAALAATSNYLVRCNGISLSMQGGVQWRPGQHLPTSADMLIPEVPCSIRYPRQWSTEERRQIREELRQSVSDGLEPVTTLWLLDHNLDDTPDNRQRADEAIRSSLASAAAYAELGYGLTWQERAAKAKATPESEATRYDVPVDVAQEAGKGLLLRTSFPNRATSGQTPTGRKALEIARALQQQDPMLLGAVREVHIWLTAHQGDAAHSAQIGQWGNDADPSGSYIEWLMHGGDAALAWTGSIVGGIS